MAKITHKLEIIVDAGEPVAEINNVISAFIQIHSDKKHEILTEVRASIDEALVKLNEGADAK
ncbi:hypothetical protein PACILC2_22980 [Paenibacillus cisolokensis]|uniref:Uncharacterized protein n=1 Tax=Paenibacillus cisolokensis TaxID=1658519 RepID=A0ABQ4N6C1_9BACL|nr:hypothetical protein [Paenibacillus cisolokensis]GIQ63730.1 hypothetical protein PACILC2_22980 [Paenibacillus cisolokensis]